jgi:hypothetical protein
MTTKSDFGVTRCCKCECPRKHEPKYACSVCGRCYTRKFSVLRHLNNLHGGQGVPILYSEYRNGKSNDNMAGAAPVVESKSPHWNVSKSQKIVALLDERIKEQVQSALLARIANIDKYLVISARACKSCLNIVFDGYFFKETARDSPFTIHLCSCRWLFDQPDIEGKRNLVETYLEERIGVSLAEVIWPYDQISDHPELRFSRVDDLRLNRIFQIGCENNMESMVTVEDKSVLRTIYKKYQTEERYIMDDIESNYVSLYISQFWWCSFISGSCGSINITRSDIVTFLQFFKSNSVKIRLRYSNTELYYALTITG